MKAAVLYDVNKFVHEEIPLEAVKSGEVRIKVAAAGICGSDIHKMQGHWKYDLPMVTGHELSGIVEEVGKGVKIFKKGDRVAVAPLIPCYQCQYCRSGQFQMCENYTMIGTHRFGGFAQYCDVPENNLLLLTDSISLEAGAMIEPLAVAAHGIMGIQPKTGDIVVVFGMGTIGLLSMEWLKLSGVLLVIGVDIDDQKLAVAKQRGCDYVINSAKENLFEKIAEYSKGRGVDISIECAGSKVTQEQCLLVTKKQGKVAYQGIGYSDVMLRQEAFENIFRRELELRGFWNSYSSPFPGYEWFNSIEFINNGKIKLPDMISHRFELAETQKAFDLTVHHQETYNKVMIYPNGFEFAEQ